jgi:hypothetical protein
MPFIRGRYHINPVLGQAMEAAREAEAARLAESEGQADGRSDANGEGNPNSGAADLNRPPIHRVEIEAAEMVPAHSGRAEKGFVARVHRQVPGPQGVASPSRYSDSEGQSPQPETRVFSNHQDLVDFLHQELGRDCSG